MKKNTKIGTEVNNSSLLQNVKFTTAEFKEMIEDATMKAKESIIEILQSHNINEVQFGPDADDEEEIFYAKEEQIFYTPIEATAYDKDGVYLVNVTKIELKEHEGKMEIYPYADSQGDVYTFGLFEGDHVELHLETYLAILEYLETFIEK